MVKAEPQEMTEPNYTDQVYEYALRVLTRRDTLDRDELERWMREPGHAEVLEELASIRSAAMPDDIAAHKHADRTKLMRRIKRGRRMQLLVTSAAAAAVVAFVLLAPTKAPVPGDTLSGLVELVLPDGEVIDIESAEGLPETIPNYSVAGDGLVQLTDTEQAPAADCLHTLKIGTGRFFRLTLADSTVVWLNSESEISYPGSFGQTERRVTLSGEAWFEVAPDSSKPFHIDFDGGSVTVLGTKFNLSAYPNDGHVYTTLAEGSVRVTAAGGETLLTPDHQCIIEKSTGEMRVAEADASDYRAWVDGRFVFRSMSLGQIMRQLERWYGVHARYNDPRISDYEFYGVFMRSSDLGSLLRAIELAVGVEARWTGNKVILSKKRNN